ncbi:hypothetical protein SVI_0587 [Shewanella violacea DSS12]|uniref:Uncharacterized protein n=1 Tax=Shewanella violacea (strain JCM 10179 / CIP 106290 / LMG 19151 / DSS12) TaxID=637905 RepID=D4ZFV9_SHEVD|nr:hypothetical protein SVI_0587 [Shewanella violacea DSS12]
MSESIEDINRAEPESLVDEIIQNELATSEQPFVIPPIM